MKKHIIISGVPRAGKSTICQMISNKFGYQHISMDSIIAGIERVFPETGINSDADTDADTNVAFISSKIAPFIQSMIESGEYNECDYGMVIDVYQLLPADFMQYIDRSVCDVFYFLTSDVTAEERFRILKANDTPKDYTYYESDEINRKKCFDIVQISKRMKAQCIMYHLPYYETANHREAAFEAFFKVLELL